MLSRTASALFWLARYVERAENIARILLAGHRMTTVMSSLGAGGGEWRSALIASGCAPGFTARYTEPDAAAVIEYMTRDPENPSSILSCIETARADARVARTACTSDMWEVLNETWHHLRTLPPDTFTPDRVPEFLEWVKQRSILFNGTYETTMLRTNAYFFTRLGTFIERMESTARILDVKYHVLLPGVESVGGAIDHHQWRSILAALSAVRAYQWIYQSRIQPARIAELLILRPEMPRSLLSGCAVVEATLERIATANGGRRGECQEMAADMHRQLREGRVDDIFRDGLHEYLTRFIDSSILLGEKIGAVYM